VLPPTDTRSAPVDAVGEGSSIAQSSSSLAGSSVLPGQRTPDGILLQAGPGRPAGDSRVVRMTVEGRERGYLLVPPLGLATAAPAGLLVVLHQDIGSARAVAEGLGLDALRRKGIALAYPAGVGGSWNAGTCCGVAKKQGVDDVAFVNAVLDDASRRVRVDPRRRGLLGYSGGGMLAYRVLCSPHRPLAAVVEVSGSLEAPCAPGLRLPDLLSIHGELDGTVGLTKPIRVRHLGMSPRTVQSTLTTVTELAGCSDRRTTDRTDARVVRWSRCASGSSVDAQIVRDAGHGWADIGAARRALPFLVERLASKA